MSLGKLAIFQSRVEMDLCIHHKLEAQAKRNPNAIAIAAPGRTPMTYQGVCDRVNDVVTKLNAIGVGRQDRVAIALPNGPEMALAFLGIASGATCAPLNPAYKTKEFDFYLSDLNAKALIVQAGVAEDAVTVAQARGIPIIELSPVLEAEAGSFTLTGGEPSSPDCGGLAEPDEIALVLHTSGTTSRPKMVPLKQRNLCTSAQNIRLALDLVESDRCLNIMPLFHIHGLIAALLSSVTAGGSVVCTPGFYAPKFFAWLEESRPTWYSAVPTMHQAILARADANRAILANCPIRFIRSSSAALPPQVMAQLEHLLSAPVIEAYGMTEASHQITSNPLPPKTRKPGSVGVAAGPEVAILDDAGNLLELGEIGEIAIRGENVTQGYENNPTANESAFTNGWFRTGDQGYLDSDRYLFIKDRIKEIINRGGEKISPREVDEVLLDHPAVAQALTFAVPHPQLGEDVAAAVVLHQQASATAAEIQAFAAAQLVDFKVPRQVIFLDEIPKGPTGKLQRIGLADKLGISALEQEEPPAVFTAPSTTIEAKLTQIWSEILGVEQVGIHDNFFQLGGDSVLAARLFTQIETVFGKNLPLATLFQAATVKQLASLLSQTDWQAPWSSLVTIRESGSKPPLFCIHGGGFNLLIYHDLANYLGPDYPVYGLQAQGLNGTTNPHRRYEDMAADYIKHMQTVQPNGPYLLAGISAGGIIALEMAQQLHAQGQKVDLLVMFDTHGPDNRGKVLPPIPRLFSVLGYALRYTVPRFVDKRMSYGAKAMIADVFAEVRNGIKKKHSNQNSQATTHLPKPEQMTDGTENFSSEMSNLELWVHNLNMWIIERSQLAYLAPQVDILGRGGSLADAAQKLEAAHLEAQLNYKMKVYPGQITVFRAKEQPPGFYRDRQFGWGSIAAGGLEIYDMPGYHADIVKSPVIAEQLRTCIDQAVASYI